MEPFSALMYAGISVTLLMTVLYFVHLNIGEADIVDVAWAYLIGAVSVWYVYSSGFMGGKQLLLLLFTTTWSLRLGTHLLSDRFFQKGEDKRYAKLRAHWGREANYKFLFVFLAQAALVILLSVSFLPIAYDASTVIGGFEIAAITVWLVALIGESVSDSQLKNFKSDPDNASKVCSTGLWRYSRHPNYFFEWLHWFSFPLLAAHSPFGWLSLSAPVLMYIFIIYVTGIPWAEQQSLKSRGELYKEYQNKTSIFFPWFPKESKA